MTSNLDAFNRGFGISYAPINGDEPMSSNIVKLEFTIPFFGACLSYAASNNRADIDKPLKARAILSSTIIGLPLILAVDIIASLTTQIANAVLSKDK